MSNSMLIVVFAVVAVLLIAVGFSIARRRREHLKARFGPEYERAVREVGDHRRAETVLQQRENRVQQYHIRPLSAEEGQRFGQTWRAVQARFVDDPSAAVVEADALASEVMATRGYPMGDFDRRAEDLSVDHPHVVQRYREAHGIADRHSRSAVSTEELRQAVVSYRALVEDLLDVREPERRRA